MKFNSYYKTSTGVLIAILVFTFLFFGLTPQTYAAWGFGDINTDAAVAGTTGATTGTTASTAGTTAADLVKEFALDVVAYTVAQELANYLVSKFTTWVNNGFDGNPFYVPDQKSFMKEFQDTEILKMYESFEDGYNSATDKQVILGILESQKQSLTQKLTPTLSDTQQREFSNDFSRGGWDTWDELIKPANNVLGRNKIIAQEYTKRVGLAQDAARQELLQGEGYLSKKECAVQGQGSSSDQSSGTTGPPPPPEFDINNELIDEDEEYTLTDEEIASDQAEIDALYENYNPDDNQSGYGSRLGNSFNVELQNFSYDPNCERWETQTPGKLISSSINRASDQQFEGLTSADEFSEIASAALGAMVDAMVNKGLSELKSSADRAFSGSNRNSVAGIEYLGNETVGYTAPDGQVDWLNAQTAVVDLELELPRAIANAGIALYNRGKDVEAQQQFLPTIEDLDYLLPGPDVGWEGRLSKHFSEATKKETLFFTKKECSKKSCQDRLSRFDSLKEQFLRAMSKSKQLIDDPRYYAYPISQQSRIIDYINGIATYGREYKSAKENLADARNLYYRLLGIKNEIMGTSYLEGSYNDDLDTWNGDTWFTLEVTRSVAGETITTNTTGNAWDEWRNEGINENGEFELDADTGNPVEEILTRETLRRQFLAIQQDVPQANILSRIKNGRTSSEQTLADMLKLLTLSEQFWADNYRISSDGKSEDFTYWRSLYSWFAEYDSDEGSSQRLGNPFRKTTYPGPGASKDVGGPWKWAHPNQLPSEWTAVPWYDLTSYPGFQNNNSLLPYVGNFDGTSVVDKLREVEASNFVDTGDVPLPPIAARLSGYKVKAFSMETEVIPSLRTSQAIEAARFNMLRRDREQRLYCGFAGWENDDISSNGDNSNKRFNAIFCSDGWYRASTMDYLKKFDIEFASSLVGAGSF